MLIAIFAINYLLIIFFLNSYYLLYFITITLVTYFAYITKFIINRYFTVIYILVIIATPFLFGFFDDSIYEIYLFMHLDKLYSYINSLVAYILVLIHASVFFFSTFKKVGL